MPALTCPRCGSTDRIFLLTPDYGFGYGTEFGHYCSGYGDRFSWADKSPEAKQRSDESRALSRANAGRLCGGGL